MKDIISYNRSSVLVSLPTLGICVVLAVLAAFFRLRLLSAVLLLLFLIGLVSRLWGMAAASRVGLSVKSGALRLFPGESTDIELEVRNDKFLPMLWAELSFPLARTLCLVPEETRPAEEWEKEELKNSGSSAALVGERKLSTLLWHETARYASRWTAQRRGVYSTDGWRLRTGDGFGLIQVEKTLPPDNLRRFAVYPALVPVRTEPFLRNHWNAETGSRGMMEDLTVIRSSRDYQTGDNARRINWRLAARGLPLTVNVYESILPRGIHFLFDGESFSGPEPHREELEDALSILASLLVQLEQRQVPCALSVCRGSGCEEISLPAAAELDDKLFALAAYEPLPPVYDGEFHITRRTAQFPAEAVLAEAQNTGRFYYISHDAAALPPQELLQRLGSGNVTVLSCLENQSFGDFEFMSLPALKEAGHGE